MRRLLPASFLCLSATLAQAQQADTVAVSPADSLCLLPITEYVPGGGTLHLAHQPNTFTSIQPALSRVAGVQVTPYSGAPGAWAAVRIRGAATVSGTGQPLYVVDGVPVYNSDVMPEQWGNIRNVFNNQLGPFQPVPRTPGANPLLDLPVEDVAAVEVLKGAAATARYGMQGTNGVILISTRRGGGGAEADQPLRVRYAGYGGLQQVRRRYELLDARGFAQVANQAAANDGLTGPAPYDEATLQRRGEVDWQQRLLRVAGVQDHNLSLDGHRGGTRYYVAADYLRQAGVVINSNLSRYHLRLNLEQQLAKGLRAELRATGTQIDQRQPGFDNDASELLRNALLAPPLRPEPNPNGFSTFDPEQQATLYYRAPRTRRLLTQLGLHYDIAPGLSAYARGGYERVYVRESYHQPDVTWPGGEVRRGSSLSKTAADSWVAEGGLRYQREFGAGHALTASLSYLRQEFQQRLRLDERSYSVSGTLGESYAHFEDRLKIGPVHSPTAAARFSYAGRYEVQASVRADVGGLPGQPAKAYWSPGGQMSWHLAKEAFVADNTGLSTLTLHVGAGRSSSYFGPDRTRHLDAGLLVGAQQNRFTLALDAYQRRTEHALALLTSWFPSPGGPVLAYLPAEAAVQNRGLELTLAAQWPVGALAGRTTLAAALNQNELQDLSYQGRPLPDAGLEVGRSVSHFRVYEQEGINPAGAPGAGTIRYRDRNNDGLRNSGDIRSLGTGLPRYSLSLTQQLRRQRFELTAQVDGLFGYQLYNSTLQALDRPNGLSNSSAQALDYWTPTRPDTDIPAPSRYNYLSPLNFPRVPTDRELASGNHLRLTQLTLSYEVVNTAERQLSVWVGGQNLLVLSSYRGYDPNVSSGGAAPTKAGLDASVYPVARVWQLGVRGRF